jgi:hypothetical protein
MTSSSSRTEAWFALRPRSLSAQLHGLDDADFGDVSFVDEWVHSRCLLPWPIPIGLRDVLGAADDAVVMVGGAVSGIYVEIWNDGAIEVSGVTGLDDSAERAVLERVARHLVTIARTPIDEATVLAMLRDATDAKGRDVMDALADQLGFRTFSDRDAWRYLGECVRLQSAMLPTEFGVARVDWDAERFVLGRGAGFVGLWDRLAPDAPIRRWRDDDDAWFFAARSALTELVVTPILRSYRLGGERVWAPAKAPCEPTVYYHYSRHSFEVLIARDLPVTLAAASSANVVVNESLARDAGLEAAFGMPNTGWASVRLGSARDARVLASSVVRGALEHDWMPVPDDVAPTLDATNAWVFEQASRD